MLAGKLSGSQMFQIQISDPSVSANSASMSDSNDTPDLDFSDVFSKKKYLYRFNLLICFHPGRLGTKPDSLSRHWDVYPKEGNNEYAKTTLMFSSVIMTISTSTTPTTSDSASSDISTIIVSLFTWSKQDN
jgi:hypothetical protein